MDHYKLGDINCKVVQVESFKINENNYTIKRTVIESEPNFDQSDPLDVFFLFKNTKLVTVMYSYGECTRAILSEYKYASH